SRSAAFSMSAPKADRGDSDSCSIAVLWSACSALRLPSNRFEVSIDLIEVREIVAGDHANGRRQRFRAALVVPADPRQLGRRQPPGPRQIELPQGSKQADELSRIAIVVPLTIDPRVLPRAENWRLVFAQHEPHAIAVNPLAVGEVPDDLERRPLPFERPRA